MSSTEESSIGPPSSISVDEWIFSDINGENSIKNQKESFGFLSEFRKNDDILVIRMLSPWTEKLYGLMKQMTPQVRAASKILQSIIRDSKKCRIYYNGEIKKLPSDLEKEAPRKDLYLVELLYTAKPDEFVTTDSVLLEFITTKINLNACQRDVFLIAYSCPNRR
ncbi:MAG: hypothetical protein JRN61_05060 [Nitrososphaerota archaeon]|nr:hypothetical protein [Nitrososphaerota archaeon]